MISNAEQPEDVLDTSERLEVTGAEVVIEGAVRLGLRIVRDGGLDEEMDEGAGLVVVAIGDGLHEVAIEDAGLGE